MANIAPGLNFKIGADVKGINKAIREAEKSLRGAVQSFSNIGNSLSLALSAPLAAFGAMAVKTAGQMESLRFALEGTMKDAGRSTADAAKELEALRVAALAPGLDFEQAVRGSVRLQSVGIEAEKAREIIVQLANALALSGGTADQLDGVTKQFTQMIGKGKILQEDISIILENMPALAKVMKDEFGASTAAGLNEAGVSVEKFIAGLTKGMQELPRATGGIANAITNAMSAVQQALADIGTEIDKTFNISGALNDFGKWVQDLAAWFKGLDEGTKRLIASIATFAATLGPALVVTMKLTQAFGAGYIMLGKLNKGYAETGNVLGALAVRWKALDTVAKASVIGATVAVVLALGAAFYVLNNNMTAAAQTARAMEAVNKSAADAASEARAKTQYLVEVIKDENAGYQEKQGALKKLNEIAPEYFKGLSIEKSSIDDLNRAYDSYIDSILRAARAKAAEEKLIELDKEAIALAEKKNRLSVESAAGSKYETMGFNAMAGAQKTAADTKAELIAQTEKEIAGNKAAMDALKGVIRENTTFVETKKTETKAVENSTNAIKSNVAAIKKAQDALKMPTLDKAQQAQPTVTPLFDSKGLADAAVSASTVGATIVTALTPAQALIKSLSTETLTFGEAFQVVAESMAENGTIFQEVGWGIASALDSVAAAGGGFKEMADGILQNLKKVIGGLIKTGVTAVVTKALLTSALNPFAALALGAASGALAQGLFNSLINKIKIPALSQGGVLTSPQLVMAGEYSGARTNPEIVTPESKMRDVFGEVMRNYGGGSGGTLSVRVSGDDLLFILDKAEKKAGRKR